MTRLTFNSPFLLGFENIERLVEQFTSKTSDGFPPYNIEQISDSQLRITLAVAGYEEKDLEVFVDGAELIIRGHNNEKQANYIYRGIASRHFQKSFMLSSSMKVDGAFLDKGLLHIVLSRVDTLDVKRIEIINRDTQQNHLELKQKKEEAS